MRADACIYSRMQAHREDVPAGYDSNEILFSFIIGIVQVVARELLFCALDRGRADEWAGPFTDLHIYSTREDVTGFQG